MKNNVHILEDLDNYFAKKSETERWIIILGIAAIVGYLLYLYLYPYAESRYNASLREKTTLEKKIKGDTLYLRSITVNGDRNYYINKYNEEIQKLKAKILDYRQRIAMLNKSFKKLSEVLFNQQNWSKFLDSISKRAQQNGVKLLRLDNQYVHDKNSFGHVLEVGIRCEGKFQSILSFLNDLEQNKLVTDVTASDIRVSPDQKDILADINISVWGVNR
ncbi:type 4a pilus biogenesis protein PilO [Nitratifractor sp.]